jgi:hypothetical protein
MRAVWAFIIIGILIGGTVMGVASLLLLPLVGGVLLLALIVWFLQRRARGEPPLR